MPQPHRKVTALRWPWGDIRFLPCIGCLANRAADSRRPCGGLTALLRRAYGKLVVACGKPWGCRTVASRSHCGHFTVFDFMNHRAVAVTFVTTTTIARKTIRFLKIIFYKPETAEPYGDRTAAAWYVTKALQRKFLQVKLNHHWSKISFYLNMDSHT